MLKINGFKSRDCPCAPGSNSIRFTAQLRADSNDRFLRSQTLKSAKIDRNIISMRLFCVCKRGWSAPIRFQCLSELTGLKQRHPCAPAAKLPAVSYFIMYKVRAYFSLILIRK